MFKNETVPARIIDAYDDVMVAECLVDKENRVYEEREFPSVFFGERKIGDFCTLQFTLMDGLMCVELRPYFGIEDEDFPRINFKEKFEKSSLFKKKT